MRGITHPHHLASLSMQDYSKCGVVLMEDRKRLFQLVQSTKASLTNGGAMLGNSHHSTPTGSPAAAVLQPPADPTSRTVPVASSGVAAQGREGFREKGVPTQ